MSKQQSYFMLFAYSVQNVVNITGSAEEAKDIRYHNVKHRNYTVRQSSSSH